MLQPHHRLGDLARVMLPGGQCQPRSCQTAATSCPGGRGLCLPKKPAWDTSVDPHTFSGPPCTSWQQAQALIALLWFLSLLFKNKTNKQKRQKKTSNCFSPKSLCVPVSERRAPGRHVLVGAHGAQRSSSLGHARGLASRCLDVCFFSVS